MCKETFASNYPCPEPGVARAAWVCRIAPWTLAGVLLVLSACATPPPADAPLPEPRDDTAPQQPVETEPNRPPKDEPAPMPGDPETEGEHGPPPVIYGDLPVEPAGEPTVTTDLEPERESETPEERTEARETNDPLPEETRAEPPPPEPDHQTAPEQPTRALAGRVRILENGREQPFASMHLNQTVVAWMPDQPVTAGAMPERQIVTRQRRFFPQTLVVTSGTPVRFPNMDPIDHNVFSLTPGHRFDVGRYGESEGRTHVFEGSGMVEILCNLHPNMTAFLLVLETPYFASPDEDGRFRLEGLPNGPGELLVWNHRASEQVQRLVLDSAANPDHIQIDVDITRATTRQRAN